MIHLKLYWDWISDHLHICIIVDEWYSQGCHGLPFFQSGVKLKYDKIVRLSEFRMILGQN